jgi:cytoskeletal protein CcmA (bactofilin family)
MKHRLGWLLAAIILIVPGAAMAFGTATGDTVTIAKNQTRQGTLYVAGSAVTIEGTVNGDLFCAGSNITITGSVTGDVICAGQTVTVSGPVGGSVRVAGQTVTLTGAVARNATLFGQTVTVGDGARIAGDVGMFAQAATVTGEIARDLHGGIQSLTINGAIGAVAVTSQMITLGQQAKVNGDLAYSSERQLPIDNAKVDGTVRFTPRADHQDDEATSAAAQIAGRLYWIVATLVTAAALLLLAPRLLRRTTDEMLAHPGSTLGWGAIIILSGPMLFIALAISVLGLPLMFLAAGIWLAALLLSPLFVGLAAGRLLLKRLDWQADSLWWAAGIGIFITMAIMSVPVVGPFLTILGTLWAVGGLALTGWKARGKAA